MEVHEDEDIVIIGAGIAGLTTALALHRLGLKSLVLESSESLRITGFALTLWTNAWKALDAVGIGDSLRQKSTQMKGFKIASPDTGLFTSQQALDKDGKFKGYESRCVKRKDLMDTLVSELPPDTIRYSSKVVAIDEHHRFKLVHLANGSILKTKEDDVYDPVNEDFSEEIDVEEDEDVISNEESMNNSEDKKKFRIPLRFKTKASLEVATTHKGKKPRCNYCRNSNEHDWRNCPVRKEDETKGIAKKRTGKKD